MRPSKCPLCNWKLSTCGVNCWVHCNPWPVYRNQKELTVAMKVCLASKKQKENTKMDKKKRKRKHLPELKEASLLIVGNEGMK